MLYRIILHPTALRPCFSFLCRLRRQASFDIHNPNQPRQPRAGATIENVINDILALLITERDRLNRALEALQGQKRRGRPPKSAAAPAVPETKPRRGRKRMSAAARKAHSKRMKKYWAAKRNEKK